MEHDFDYLKNLYTEDPDEFKRITDTVIGDYIESVPTDKQDKLRRKQWVLEQELSHFKDPLARMNRMVQIFWEGVNEFREVTNDPFSKTNVSSNNEHKGTVVEFKKK